MSDHVRNFALAATLPDGEQVRESSIRIRAHNSPLSSDLKRLADAVRRQSLDIEMALAGGNAAHALQLMEGLKSKQTMLARELDKHAATAAAHEAELLEKMRMLRDVLEARHGG